MQALSRARAEWCGQGATGYLYVTFIMLYGPMPRSGSGRIVIEVEPDVKRRLYAALSLNGSTSYRVNQLKREHQNVETRKTT